MTNNNNPTFEQDRLRTDIAMLIIERVSSGRVSANGVLDVLDQLHHGIHTGALEIRQERIFRKQ